jgi:hypothetical protein
VGSRTPEVRPAHALKELREAARRRVLAGFDVVRDVDGTPREVAAGRERN